MVKLTVPVIGILRGIEASFFGPLMDAAFANGLQAIEVTFNTAHVEKIIARQRPRVLKGKLLGMGTIRNLEEARRAVDAGAMFMVTPNLDPAVIEYGQMHHIPVVAGAFTPTEVYAAWSAGASMVKVFPCSQMGPEYIRDLLGPFDHIPLAAVGGVNRQNLNAYFEAGVTAVGVGSALFGRQAIATQRPEDIGHNVSEFLTALNPSRLNPIVAKVGGLQSQGDQGCSAGPA
jgi:2-dehydro-3-deoxyphosphogluconate aldolase / (4S)-4-hydroxy-2-oxoglutarate aldolase